jgi:hypothetical protein
MPKCAAPLLSVIRHRHDVDVEVPAFGLNGRAPYEPHSVPWGEKRDVGFFRWACQGRLEGSRPASFLLGACTGGQRAKT